jgi:hypothetical protein
MNFEESSFAVYKVYRKRGNSEYAHTKTSNFLRRCGLEGDDKYQEVDPVVIKQIAYAALDEEAEKELLKLLGL